VQANLVYRADRQVPAGVATSSLNPARTVKIGTLLAARR